MQTFSKLQGPIVIADTEPHWYGPYGNDRFINSDDTIIVNQYQDSSTAPGSENLVLQQLDTSGNLVSSKTIVSNFPVEATGNGFDYRQIADNQYLIVWGQANTSDPSETNGQIIGEVVDVAGNVITGPSILANNIPTLNNVLANARATLGQSYIVTYSTFDPQSAQENINYIEYSLQGAQIGSGSLYSAVQQDGSYHDYHIETLTPAGQGDPEFVLAKTSDADDTNGYVQYQLLNANVGKLGDLQTVAPTLPQGATNVVIESQKLASLLAPAGASYNLLAAYGVQYTVNGNSTSVIDLHLINTFTNAEKIVEINVGNAIGVGFVNGEVDGGFILTYSSGSSKIIQRFDNQGDATSQPYILPNVSGKYNLSVEPNGNILVLFKTNSSSGQQIKSELIGTAPPCYVTGTHILTDEGEKTVESLKVGDLVVTEAGGRRPIVWVGHRKLDLVCHPDAEAVWPVRVLAGAFGTGLPRCDLWLSPRHAVFVDGVLIPVIHLANGTSIAQVQMSSVTYWHVELGSHDIVYANGLPAESYLDCGNRGGFVNGGTFVELYPNFTPKSLAETYAPLEEAGPVVASVKSGLLNRAEIMGFGTTQDCDLHVMAGDITIAPQSIGEGYFDFAIPAGDTELRLVSRTWCPAHMLPDSADRRKLGVLVTRLEVDERPRDIRTLGEGWLGIEGDGGALCRWTNGSATLPPGSRRIVVQIGDGARYWVPCIEEANGYLSTTRDGGEDGVHLQRLSRSDGRLRFAR